MVWNRCSRNSEACDYFGLLRCKSRSITAPLASIAGGDTFRRTGGKKIRIHGIDAPAMDTQQGSASQAALAEMSGGEVVDCGQYGAHTPSGQT